MAVHATRVIGVGRARVIFRHVGKSSSLSRSLEYYQELLGFGLHESSGSVARLGAAGVTLLELHERKAARAVPPSGLLGLFHFAILLPDRASLGRFLGHLNQQDLRFGASDHLVSEAIYLQDPDNLGVEVYADRPRSTWSRDGDEVMMTTIPMDDRGVLQAGEGLSWTGMPPGTTIGHVHLRVGNLEDAEAFYHRALGLDKIVWSYPGALFLSAGGYHHHLGTNTWARGAARANEDDARLLQWELVLPTAADVRAAGRSLESEGYAVRAIDEAVIAKDPWGTELRLAMRSSGVVAP